MDAAGNLYVADPVSNGRIQKRDTQGNWSVLAPTGSDLGQVQDPSSLAVDMVGHLYVADTGNDRIQEYAPGGP